MPQGAAFIKEKMQMVDAIIGYRDLVGDNLVKYKELRKAELEAELRTVEFLDSLLTDEQRKAVADREAIYEERRDDFISCNVGDGMDEDKVDTEVAEMSDYEFYHSFVVEIQGV